MSASAILNILIGLAVGGWMIWGGLAGKISDAVGGSGSSGSAKVSATTTDKPTGTATGGLVMV